MRNKGNPRFTHNIVQKVVEQPGGFMVYFPKGHALRMTEVQLKRYGLKKTGAGIVDLEGLIDGKLAEKVFAESDEADRNKLMERRTIALATKKTGTNLLTKEEKIVEVV